MRAGGENQTSGKLARQGLWAFQRPRPCRPLQYNVILLTFLRPDRTLGPMTGKTKRGPLWLHRNLNGGPVRDYVPLLVEHAAKKRLTKLAAEVRVSGGLSSVLARKQPAVDNP
jgi:hypothetical protein